VDLDAGLVAFLDRRLGLGTRRVVETLEAVQDQVLLDQTSVGLLARRRRGAVPRLRGEAEHSETFLRKSFDVGEDLLLHLVVERRGTVGELNVGASIKDALDGTLHEDVLFAVGRPMCQLWHESLG
jgi:hypothetical protein